MRTRMAKEITIEELRTMARRAGLPLPDDELLRLLPGVKRAQSQAAALRELFTNAAEPATIFTTFKIDLK
jgi:hypothetical protein